MSYRTNWCGEVTEAMVDDLVQLAGWVHRRRDHGNLVFIDLRDRTGLVQLVFDPARAAAAHATSHVLRNEFVISATGTVVRRDDDRINPNLPTGTVEVAVDELHILAEAKTPPFLPDDHGEVDETVRLKYRYLDLRRPRMQRNLRLRDRAAQSVRRSLETQGFLEIETPILTKSTPEGARDFLVPSRLQLGQFYALPQSPQLFKQLLMMAGYERYYQLARAFRDEDLRADRQPEHTQIDLEMSFVQEEDIQDVVEEMICAVFAEALGIDVGRPFPRMTYAEAMRRFGSDKPDMRFAMEIVDVSDLAAGSEFRVFSETLASGGVVRGLRAAEAGAFSRKDVDDLAAVAGPFGVKGLAPIWVEEGEFALPSPSSCLRTLWLLYWIGWRQYREICFSSWPTRRVWRPPGWAPSVCIWPSGSASHVPAGRFSGCSTFPCSNGMQKKRGSKPSITRSLDHVCRIRPSYASARRSWVPTPMTWC